MREDTVAGNRFSRQNPWLPSRTANSADSFVRFPNPPFHHINPTDLLMKPMTTNNRLRAAFGGLLLTTSVQAVPPPALPPNPITTWTAMADTGSTPGLTHAGTGAVSTFAGFTPPVVIGAGTGTAPTQIAYKGRMNIAGPVTIANDEAIWSNGDPINWSTTPPGATSWMVAQEGDVVAGNLIGGGTSMLVEALQTTPYGGTLFTTNSSATTALNLSVYEGGTLNGLAGVSASGFADGGRAVTDGQRIAAWAKNGTLATGTRFWDVTATPSFPHGLTAGIIRWTATNNPKVPCSPVISEYGGVAHRARSGGLPVFERDLIIADPISPSGLFPAATPVVRKNALAPTGERFGVFHPNLMAITGGPNINPTVAWQMSNMYTNVGAGLLGAPIPSSNSLWCWSYGTLGYLQIARVGDVLTDFTSPVTIKGFYALHLVEDRGTWRDSDVFYGVRLSTPGKTAIYHRHITYPLIAGGPLSFGPLELIATDEPSGPVSQHVPSIYPGGPYPIATLFPWFSVDVRGNVLIKATLGGAAPAGQKQCLISARAPTHAMEMRARSQGRHQPCHGDARPEQPHGLPPSHAELRSQEHRQLQHH